MQTLMNRVVEMYFLDATLLNSSYLVVLFMSITKQLAAQGHQQLGQHNRCHMRGYWQQQQQQQQQQHKQAKATRTAIMAAAATATAPAAAAAAAVTGAGRTILSPVACSTMLSC